MGSKSCAEVSVSLLDKSPLLSCEELTCWMPPPHPVWVSVSGCVDHLHSASHLLGQKRNSLPDGSAVRFCNVFIFPSYLVKHSQFSWELLVWILDTPESPGKMLECLTRNEEIDHTANTCGLSFNWERCSTEVHTKQASSVANKPL